MLPCVVCDALMSTAGAATLSQLVALAVCVEPPKAVRSGCVGACTRTTATFPPTSIPAAESATAISVAKAVPRHGNAVNVATALPFMPESHHIDVTTNASVAEPLGEADKLEDCAVDVAESGIEGVGDMLASDEAVNVALKNSDDETFAVIVVE